MKRRAWLFCFRLLLIPFLIVFAAAWNYDGGFGSFLVWPKTYVPERARRILLREPYMKVAHAFEKALLEQDLRLGAIIAPTLIDNKSNILNEFEISWQAWMTGHRIDWKTNWHLWINGNLSDNPQKASICLRAELFLVLSKRKTEWRITGIRNKKGIDMTAMIRRGRGITAELIHGIMKSREKRDLSNSVSKHGNSRLPAPGSKVKDNKAEEKPPPAPDQK